MFKIIDEHAWLDGEDIHAELKLSHKKEGVFRIGGYRGKETTFYVDKSDKITENESIETQKESYVECYHSYEDCHNSIYADYFAIIERMMNECAGKIQRVSYEIVEQYSRMADNVFEKIPEAEMEIEFLDGSILYAFAYKTASYEEYALSRKSWFAQEEEGAIDRDQDILESYDSFQESLHSDYPELFFTLREMLVNEVEYDQQFGEMIEEEEYDE